MEPASEDFKNDGISFIWKIHNYSFGALSNRYHLKEYLQSPALELNAKKFSLLVYSQLPVVPYNIGFRLFIEGNKNARSQIIDYEVSILTTSGLFEKLVPISKVYDNPDPGTLIRRTSLLQLPSRHENEGGFHNYYLCDDTLTVKCRIFKVNGVVLDRQICCVHTAFNVERTIYNWNTDTLFNSNQLTFEANAKPNLFANKNVTINAKLDECSNGEKLKVLIKRGSVDELSFSICTISIVEDGKITHSKQYERWFSKSLEEQIWEVSFIPNINFKNLEEENCKKNLRLQFATSDGSSTIEKIEHDTSKEEDSNFVSGQPTPSNGVQSWKENLQHFFSEGKFSDLTLRILEREFPVHKAMLCAQSKVFSAMFEHDTKENQTGVVDIEDLEAETVSRLLHYVYTGIIEDMECEKATKLYFAADKYEITGLKEQCSQFIKTNLSALNVCKCLILADMHGDQPLKAFTQKFVLKHSSVVMQSEEWKELMKNYVNLAAETMYLSFLKNS